MNNWPSTTQVLADAGLYGDISRWTSKADREQPEEYACAGGMARGRAVDGGCNLLLMRKQLDVAWCRKHEACCLPFLDGYKEFLRRHDVKLIDCAFEVVNKAERYVGHPDQVVMLDGVRATLDIKSGAMPAVTKFQLASYDSAQRSMGMPRTLRVGIQLSRGDFKPHYFTDPRDLDFWVIEVRHWWNKRSLGITFGEAELLSSKELEALAQLAAKREAA